MLLALAGSLLHQYVFFMDCLRKYSDRQTADIGYMTPILSYNLIYIIQKKHKALWQFPSDME